jgi:hypothetical protein
MSTHSALNVTRLHFSDVSRRWAKATLRC